MGRPQLAERVEDHTSWVFSLLESMIHHGEDALGEGVFSNVLGVADALRTLAFTNHGRDRVAYRVSNRPYVAVCVPSFPFGIP